MNKRDRLLRFTEDEVLVLDKILALEEKMGCQDKKLVQQIRDKVDFSLERYKKPPSEGSQ